MKTKRLTTCMLISCLASATLLAPKIFGAEPSPEQVRAAMKKAATFMIEKVSLHGGHVWVVSEDLTQRWGEVPARASQIWLQGGTEEVGGALLDAYDATRDSYYLDGARKAADALIFGQHPLGGWHYFIDFDPAGVQEWYESTASRFRWGLEEYRHFYGNATFDDQVTPRAAEFLLRFYRTTKEAAYREPLLKALDFVLLAQYPNGAWPQRYPLRYDYAHDGLPDYTSFYTLNDGAAQANIELLLDAYEALGDSRYFEGARRGVEALITLQGPEDQGCWAEQYGPDMRPVAARTHEPAGYVVRESLGVIELLQEFFLRTGDARYLAPVPRCLAWFERINRESAAERYPIPRYWEPRTNRPLYFVRTDQLTPEGYGKYKWTTQPQATLCDGEPCKGDGKPIVDVAMWSARQKAIAALDSPQARSARLAASRRKSIRPRSDSDGGLEKIISSMDRRGAWVTDGISVPRAGTASEPDVRIEVRGISTQTFVRNLSTLAASLRKGS